VLNLSGISKEDIIGHNITVQLFIFFHKHILTGTTEELLLLLG
jgi:hypothetical protein